jgi:lipopolysaccharide biosynthesis glycosyltransferase
MKIIAFTVADKNNKKYADNLIKSFKHFHPDIEIKLYGEEEIAKFNDSQFFYRQKATIAKELIEDYDLVLGLDADQLVVGSLDAIFERNDHDIDVVYNWNRVDPKTYGEIGLATIAPTEYYNCGLVAMRSKKFIDHWYDLCHSKHFERMPYREQGFLNVLAHYGGYSVRCLDNYDAVYNDYSWYGLISKGEWNRCIIKDGEMVLPPDDTNYPQADTTIKVIHWAGGNMPNKQNYKIYFNEECIEYIDKILNDGKSKKKQ